MKKWCKIADNACFDIRVNSVLESTNLREGDDIADLIVLAKQQNYNNSPQGILDKLISKNSIFSKLIHNFDLVLECN